MSIAGVALAAAAMVIVLSVFNGFSKFAELKMTKTEPSLTIVRADGRVFASADSIAHVIAGVSGVESASAVIEQRAFAISGEMQAPVIMRGISPEGYSAAALSTMIIDGEAILQTEGELSTAISSIGVANALRTTPSYPRLVRLYEPKRTARINPAAPMTAFRVDSLYIAGVYQTEQQESDRDYLYIPLPTARRLLNYTNFEATSIEVASTEGVNLEELQRAVSRILPPEFSVKTRIELQQASAKMIAVEKWVTMAVLVFVLIVASFNILSTMSMLIVEKRSNHAVLYAMGATPRFISRIYAWLSFIITAIGGGLGVLLGVGVSLAQQEFEFVKLNAQDVSAMAITAYPVSVEASDVALVAVAVVAIGALTATVSAAVSGKK